LYWPPVLGSILLLALAAEVWLYVVHGVGGSVHDALYKPGFMLVVLGVIVCSAGFHELGHAAALRYGGGQVRGMGAGMYMVYPAFYTDVSDNYRLPRWARVRTDLGGFYFNMILSLGIFGLFLLTNQEALLLVVTLINFEILHQLLPFLRLDGYWALADLTGIPDFFSQMGGFVRSVLPGARLKGRKLPELKWWAKVVFGLYMLVTIPLLCFLLFFMVKSVPRVIATTWDAIVQQASQFVQGLGAADVLLMLGAAGQALLLCLPVLGLTYTLYRLGRSGFTLLYVWSRPSLLRQVVATFAGMAAIALVVLLWAPQLPFGLFGGRPGLAVTEASYTPIGANERLTVGDVFADVVATPTPGATPARPMAEEISATAEPTPFPTAMPTSTEFATPVAMVPPPTAVPQLTPVPTQINRMAVASVSPVPRRPGGSGRTPGALPGPNVTPRVAKC
jgi:putative peptide zinc metalloprotease protein